MSECVQSAPPAIAPHRSKKARREARLAKFERERLVIEYLNRGVSVPEIAAQLGVTEKRMRALVREILARRMPAPPAEFLAMQVSRLNEALLVAYSAMKGLNLRAVDRVVKIVRELDRYHGFAAAERRSRPDASHLEAPAQNPLALLASLANGAEMAPQILDKVDLAPGKRRADEVSDAEDAAPGLCEAFALRLDASEQSTLAATVSLDDRPEMAPQTLDKVDSAPGNGTAAEVPDAEDAAPGLCEAFALRLEASEQNILAVAASLDDRPEMAPQWLDKVDSGPGNGTAAEASDPQDAAPGLGEGFAGPVAANSTVAKPPNVLATPNGVVAC